MTRKKRVNKTQLQRILRESVFDPNEPGPLKVISDVGNVDYYRNRSIELISDGNLKLAIAVLALAIAHTERKP
jgi:hypothetical protein